MSVLGIFIIGVFVTLLVGAALTLVLVGAWQDGRSAREAKTRARAADAARERLRDLDRVS